jgi:phosphotriesterase-related protein
MADRVVRTVLGDRAVDSLGVTLMHEHLVIDNRVWLRPAATSDLALVASEPQIDNLWWMRQFPNMNPSVLVLSSIDDAVEEALEFKNWGGSTIVDVTSVGLGRDPSGLARIARRTGLNVVAGAGYYVGDTHSDWVRNAPVEDIAERIVLDIQLGMDESYVKAGIIGEIGLSDPMSPSEKKVLHAAALAQRRTGAAITVHNAFINPETESGLVAVEVLEKAGADLRRVIMGHMDPTSHRPEYHRALLSTGCYLEFDLFGADYFESGIGYVGPGDREKTSAVVRLIEEGFASQILLSHDVCYKIQLQRFGGYGYAHLLRNIRPRFALAGIDDGVFMDILVSNPREVLPLLVDDGADEPKTEERG